MGDGDNEKPIFHKTCGARSYLTDTPFVVVYEWEKSYRKPKQARFCTPQVVRGVFYSLLNEFTIFLPKPNKKLNPDKTPTTATANLSKSPSVISTLKKIARDSTNGAKLLSEREIFSGSALDFTNQSNMFFNILFFL